MWKETFLDIWMDGGPGTREAFQRDLNELIEAAVKRERERCARTILDTKVDANANNWRLIFASKIRELT